MTCKISYYDLYPYDYDYGEISQTAYPHDYDYGEISQTVYPHDYGRLSLSSRNPCVSELGVNRLSPSGFAASHCHHMYSIVPATSLTPTMRACSAQCIVFLIFFTNSVICQVG